MHSLRARLLAWVLLPLAAAVAVDAVITYRNAIDTASVVQDRLLLGSARIVAEQLRFEDGAFQEHIPPSALELFQSSHDDRVYYRVTTESGQQLSGYGELGLPSVALQQELPYFFDTSVRGVSVRAVAFLQPVIGEPGAQPVLVEIAQTLSGRDEMARGLWRHAVSQQVLILLLTAVLVLFGLQRGLKPVLRLRDAMLARSLHAAQPLAVTEVPQELAPLVEAVNEYARRIAQYTRAQRVFVQDAAHQLRTPFALLNAQLSFAVRSADAAGRDESLQAIRRTVQQAVRLVNQLLALSSAEADTPLAERRVTLGLDSVVRGVLEDLASQAHARHIDLGFERCGGNSAAVEQAEAQVEAHPVALREIVINLVDNAIRYTPPGGVVTTRVNAPAGGPVALTIEDNGPGIAPELRERVFERFYRIDDADSRGCGLGLPIVREFAARIGATVRLATAPGGCGLAVTVTFGTLA